MPPSALSPQEAVDRLEAMSSELRAAILLDEHGALAARAGTDGDETQRLRELAAGLFDAADVAGHRGGVEPVAGVEVSRPNGGVFAIRRLDRTDRRWTLIVVTGARALASLVLYDLRMTLRWMEPAS